MVFTKLRKNNQKSSVNKLNGCIVSANDHKVVVSFLDNTLLFQKGQHVSVGVSCERETALGSEQL